MHILLYTYKCRNISNNDIFYTKPFVTAFYLLLNIVMFQTMTFFLYKVSVIVFLSFTTTPSPKRKSVNIPYYLLEWA